MNRAMLVGATAAVLFVGSSVQAQVVDLRPRVLEERIVTDGFVDATSQTIPDHRLFVYNFGEYPSDPYFSTEPGFNAPAASGLLPESALGFNILDGSLFSWDTNLVFWNGEDVDPQTEGLQVSFGPTPASEALSLKLSGNGVTVGSELGELPGFTIQTVSASGSVHRHLSSFLEAGETDEPAPGLYLFAIELVSSAPFEDSLPAFLLYANGVGATERTAATVWIQETLVSPLQGDANLDGRVDLADFGVLKANFGKEGTRAAGDFDADGQVNLADFGLLKANFGRARQAAAVVPEPSAGVLAALALLLLTGRQVFRGPPCVPFAMLVFGPSRRAWRSPPKPPPSKTCT